MQLTYYVLLEIMSSTSDRRGRILGSLEDHIDMEDFLSDASDNRRMLFNENALKGVKEFVDSQNEPELYRLYVVAVSEDKSIFEYGDQDISKFEDIIEIYPNLDTSRVDEITLEFKRSTEQKQPGFEKSQEQIRFDKVSDIVKPVVDEQRSFDESVLEDLDDEDIVAKRLPTMDKLLEIVDAKLDIEEDSQIGEVVISQSESSLAIMQALMSDDLAEVESIDVDRINRMILSKVKESDKAKSYLQSNEALERFLDEVRSRKEEIESQYDRDMQAYIDEVVENLKIEYRKTVPDNTEKNLQEYYESINDDYSAVQEQFDRSQKDLDKEIMKIFTSSDRSSAMKALRKFLTLKEQIRESALKSIQKIHLAESSSQELDRSNKLEQERLAEQRRLEQERLEQERLEQERFAEQQRLEQERLEQERLAEQQRLEQERLEQERLEQERFEQERFAEQQRLEQERLAEAEALESLQSKEVHLIDDRNDDESEESDKSEESELQEVQDENTDDLEEDASHTDLSDSDEDDMKRSEVAKVDLSDIISEDEDEDDLDDVVSDTKKSSKMSLPVKIGLGVAAVVMSMVLVFGTLALLNSGHKSSVKKDQTVKSSAKIDDTLFNVGDVLTITGQDGASLDVTIKEFKKDGSAVAEDDNKDKWLITRDQMKEYAKAHPDQFKDKKKKSSKSSDGSKSESSGTSDSSKSEDKPADKPAENNQPASSSDQQKTSDSSASSEVPNTEK